MWKDVTACFRRKSELWFWQINSQIVLRSLQAMVNIETCWNVKVNSTWIKLQSFIICFKLFYSVFTSEKFNVNNLIKHLTSVVYNNYNLFHITWNLIIKFHSKTFHRQQSFKFISLWYFWSSHSCFPSFQHVITNDSTFITLSFPSTNKHEVSKSLN